jgi:hypothetical protein
MRLSDSRSNIPAFSRFSRLFAGTFSGLKRVSQVPAHTFQQHAVSYNPGWQISARLYADTCSAFGFVCEPLPSHLVHFGAITRHSRFRITACCLLSMSFGSFVTSTAVIFCTGLVANLYPDGILTR